MNVIAIYLGFARGAHIYFTSKLLNENEPSCVQVRIRSSSLYRFQ
jgi:hypothetical protein